jgi:HD-GYP domain-containing protein (c-di-GMP phosphodiesterase class II)
VADSYDAMTNKRAYKGVLPKYMAIEELIRNKGTQFDPHIVDVFMKLLESHEASANG